MFIVREGANRPPEQLLDPDWTFGEEVLVEEFIDGKELTVAVMHNRGALAVTEIFVTSDGDWYDFDAKYAEGGSRHVVPADIPQTVADQLMRAAEANIILDGAQTRHINHLIQRIGKRWHVLELHTLHALVV